MADKLKLTKAETVALWHAVNWMHECLKSSPPDDMEEAWQAETERLKLAQQALRKVNAVRKAQSIRRPRAVAPRSSDSPT